MKLICIYVFIRYDEINKIVKHLFHFVVLDSKDKI